MAILEAHTPSSWHRRLVHLTHRKGSPPLSPRPLGVAPPAKRAKANRRYWAISINVWPIKGGGLANYLSSDSSMFFPPTAVRTRVWKGRWISWWIPLRRTSLARPCGSTGNGLRPALRVNTLSTPSAFGWRTQGVPHTPRWQREHQHGLNGPLHGSIYPAWLARSKVLLLT